ncbi:MAG: hypothetical protein WA900_02635 [Casimicrobiaceae bacterium]
MSVGGQPVTSVSRLRARLDDFSAGERVSVGLLRDGRHVTVEATLAAGS